MEKIENTSKVNVNNFKENQDEVFFLYNNEIRSFIKKDDIENCKEKQKEMYFF
jgi:hypothetical protein